MERSTPTGTSREGFFISAAAELPESKPRKANSSTGVAPRKPIRVGLKSPADMGAMPLFTT